MGFAATVENRRVGQDYRGEPATFTVGNRRVPSGVPWRTGEFYRGEPATLERILLQNKGFAGGVLDNLMIRKNNNNTESLLLLFLGRILEWMQSSGEG